MENSRNTSPHLGFVPPAAALPAVSRTPSASLRHPPTPTSAALASAAHAPVLEASTSMAAVEFGKKTRDAPTLLTQPLPEFVDEGDFTGGAAGGKRGKVMVWFRNDLRLHDHAALAAALEEASTVVPCYVFDPCQFGRTQFGFEKTGRYRARFLRESVEGLRKGLQAKEAELVVRHACPEKVIPELCKKIGCRAVYFHQEVTYDEHKVEDKLERALREANIEVKKFWSNTLFHDKDLPFALDKMPDIYTDFREQIERAATSIRRPLPIPDAFPPLPKSIDVGEIPSLERLGVHSAASGRGVSASVVEFRGGEAEAGRRLKEYIAESKTAITSGGNQSRNLRGTSASSQEAYLGADFSCKISPWLALGCISPRKIFEDLRASFAGQNLQKSTTYFELVWRDFFRFITMKYAVARNSETAAAPQKVAARAY
mmetsp:Transcript_11439/g.28957  ORF Transcript_11439/g.28957 Transcript_11439/m.28957 type:complete len:429 (-) Transcript_11439:375-1661(-)